jgi:hypothetical protein
VIAKVGGKFSMDRIFYAMEDITGGRVLYSLSKQDFLAAQRESGRE